MSGIYMQKNPRIRIPFQILFYPFRCMFTIMNGYRIFDFTPSGKSLRKTLVKISGDGTEVGKANHFINVTCTILNDKETANSEKGHEPIIIVKGPRKV